MWFMILFISSFLKSWNEITSEICMSQEFFSSLHWFDHQPYITLVRIFSFFIPCSSGPLEPSGVSVHDIVLSGYPQNMIYLSCNLEGLSVLYLVQMSQPPSPLMKMSHGNYYKLWKSEIQRWRFLNSQSHFQPNLLVWLSIFFTCLEYKMNFIRKTFGDAFHYSIMYTL